MAVKPITNKQVVASSGINRGKQTSRESFTIKKISNGCTFFGS